MEALMAQTAITYPATTLTEMTGATIKTVLEDGSQPVQPRPVLPAG